MSIPEQTAALRLAAAELRWLCDDTWCQFDTTEEAIASAGIVGQDEGLEALIQRRIERVRAEHPSDGVPRYLDDVYSDVMEQRLPARAQGDASFGVLYRVNVVVARPSGDSCPVVAERDPTPERLFGTLDLRGLKTGAYEFWRMATQWNTCCQSHAHAENAETP